MMSVTLESVRELTFEVKKLNAFLDIKRETESLEFFQKIKECFEKVLPLLSISHGSENLVINQLASQFRLLKKNCIDLRLSEKPQIQGFFNQGFNVKHLPDKCAISLTEFVGLKEMLATRTINSELCVKWKTATNNMLVSRLNTGVSVNEIGFSESTLKDFLKTCGSKITYLNISSFTITDKELFDTCINIEGIDFSNTCFSGVNIDEILTRANWQNLKQLSFESCHISSNKMVAIAENLKGLEKLNASKNPLDKLGFEAICTHLTNLKELKISLCRIFTFETFAENLKKLKNLEKLDASRNSLCDLGFEAICTHLTNLKELDVSECSICVFGPFLENLKRLEKFDASENFFGDLGFEAICSHLTNLKKLMVNQCGISTLGPFLENLKGLEKLDASMNFFGDLGFEAICSHLTNLKELNVYHCDINTLGSFLGNLKGLEKFDASENFFGDLGFEAICTHLTNLKDLVIINCCITEAFFDQMQTSRELKFKIEI